MSLPFTPGAFPYGYGCAGGDVIWPTTDRPSSRIDQSIEPPRAGNVFRDLVNASAQDGVAGNVRPRIAGKERVRTLQPEDQLGRRPGQDDLVAQST